MHVNVRLNQRESRLFALSEFLSGECVSVIYKFELPCEDSNDRAEVKIVLGNARTGLSFQKHLFGFKIELLGYGELGLPFRCWCS